jgi:hypothetical protein
MGHAAIPGLHWRTEQSQSGQNKMASSTQELNLVEYPRSPVPAAKLVHPGMEQGDDGQPPPATFRLELEHPL